MGDADHANEWICREGEGREGEGERVSLTRLQQQQEEGAHPERREANK